MGGKTLHETKTENNIYSLRTTKKDEEKGEGLEIHGGEKQVKA